MVSFQEEVDLITYNFFDDFTDDWYVGDGRKFSAVVNFPFLCSGITTAVFQLSGTDSVTILQLMICSRTPPTMGKASFISRMSTTPSATDVLLGRLKMVRLSFSKVSGTSRKLSD